MADVDMEKLRKSNLFHEDPKKNAESAEIAIKDVRAISDAKESEYDKHSIMQYHLAAEYLVANPKCSWATQNTELSVKDWEGLKRMYPK